MKIYCGCNGNPSHIKEMEKEGYGMCIVTKFRPSVNVPKFLDNQAWGKYVSGEPWEAAPFLRMIEGAPSRGIKYNFIVIPDKVAAGLESFKFSLKWLEVLRDITDTPLYFAVQDGMTTNMIDGIMHRVDGLFIGGSMKWKKRTGERWGSLAHKHGKPCHIGRIGTFKNLVWAQKIGADSIDSANFPRHGTFNIIKDAKAQGVLVNDR